MMKKILIVDDEKAMLHAMRRDLSEFNDKYDVHLTSNSNEVLKLLIEKDIDILITDILMPDKEGIEIIREVKRDCPTVKIISMSGGVQMANFNILSIAEDLGSVCSLSKPFTRDELLAAINKAISIDD